MPHFEPLPPRELAVLGNQRNRRVFQRFKLLIALARMREHLRDVGVRLDGTMYRAGDLFDLVLLAGARQGFAERGYGSGLISLAQRRVGRLIRPASKYVGPMPS